MRSRKNPVNPYFTCAIYKKTHWKIPVLYNCSAILPTLVFFKVLSSFQAIIFKENKASVSKLILSCRWETFTFHRLNKWRVHVSQWSVYSFSISRRVGLRACIYQIKAVYPPVTCLKRCQMDNGVAKQWLIGGVKCSGDTSETVRNSGVNLWSTFVN